MYDESKLKKLIKSALSEDIGRGDVTSRAVIPPSIKAKGKLVAKAFGIIAGLDVAKKVFEDCRKNDLPQICTKVAK